MQLKRIHQPGAKTLFILAADNLWELGKGGRRWGCDLSPQPRTLQRREQQQSQEGRGGKAQGKTIGYGANTMGLAGRVLIWAAWSPGSLKTGGFRLEGQSRVLPARRRSGPCPGPGFAQSSPLGPQLGLCCLPLVALGFKATVPCHRGVAEPLELGALSGS